MRIVKPSVREQRRGNPPRGRGRHGKLPIGAFTCCSAGLVGLATLAGLPLRSYMNPTNLVMLYFVAVMVAAIWLGLYPAIVASLISVIAFDVLFVPPYYALAIDDAQYLLTFAGLLAVSLVISTLTARAREQELAARRREAQTVALNELSQKLEASAEMPEIAQTAVHAMYRQP